MQEPAFDAVQVARGPEPVLLQRHRSQVYLDSTSGSDNDSGVKSISFPKGNVKGNLNKKASSGGRVSAAAGRGGAAAAAAAAPPKSPTGAKKGSGGAR